MTRESVSGGQLAVAVLGLTGTGKSALAIALALRFRGEVVSCDSTAVYRGFDIGTDKVPADARRGVPHHLIDVADPAEQYTAARYAREAAEAIRSIDARGCLPVIVGGTGFYFRALTRGLFPGPGRNPRLRARLDAVAARRGSEFLHRALRRVDPASAARIQPRDRMRARAGARSLSAHRPAAQRAFRGDGLAARDAGSSSRSACACRPPSSSCACGGASTGSLQRGSWTRFGPCSPLARQRPRSRSAGSDTVRGSILIRGDSRRTGDA